MAIDQARLRSSWVKQTGANCGSCCVASIVNYAWRKRSNENTNIMDNTNYVGLFVSGVESLGSVTARLAQWARDQHRALFENVTEVKISGKRQHWGGIANSKLLSGGASHRPKITADGQYFSRHPDRFLLRECSAWAVLGHFIIQTGADEFWDPNQSAWLLPMDLAAVKSAYNWVGDISSLSVRAEGCQFDVAGTYDL
jgi:hypothetical protein